MSTKLLEQTLGLMGDGPQVPRTLPDTEVVLERLAEGGTYG